MDLADYDVNAFSSDDEVRRPRIFRYRPNYFEEYDQKDFFNRFRLSPRTVENLVEEIQEAISHLTHRYIILSIDTNLRDILILLSTL